MPPVGRCVAGEADVAECDQPNGRPPRPPVGTKTVPSGPPFTHGQGPSGGGGGRPTRTLVEPGPRSSMLRIRPENRANRSTMIVADLRGRPHERPTGVTHPPREVDILTGHAREALVEPIDRLERSTAVHGIGGGQVVHRPIDIPAVIHQALRLDERGEGRRLKAMDRASDAPDTSVIERWKQEPWPPSARHTVVVNERDDRRLAPPASRGSERRRPPRWVDGIQRSTSGLRSPSFVASTDPSSTTTTSIARPATADALATSSRRSRSMASAAHAVVGGHHHRADRHAERIGHAASARRTA